MHRYNTNSFTTAHCACRGCPSPAGYLQARYAGLPAPPVARRQPRLLRGIAGGAFGAKKRVCASRCGRASAEALGRQGGRGGTGTPTRRTLELTDRGGAWPCLALARYGTRRDDVGRPAGRPRHAVQGACCWRQRTRLLVVRECGAVWRARGGRRGARTHVRHGSDTRRCRMPRTRTLSGSAAARRHWRVNRTARAAPSPAGYK